MNLQKIDPQKAVQYFKDKLTYTAGPTDVKHWLDEKANVNIVDVRRAEDYERGHIPGAVNLPREKWSSLQGLQKDKINVFYCYSQQCHLAPAAAVEFSQKGFQCVEMEGGFDAWEEVYKLPVESMAGARR